MKRLLVGAAMALAAMAGPAIAAPVYLSCVYSGLQPMSITVDESLGTVSNDFGNFPAEFTANEVKWTEHMFGMYFHHTLNRSTLDLSVHTISSVDESDSLYKCTLLTAPNRKF